MASCFWTSQLLKPSFKYFDAHNYPCYLETHKKKNVAVYEHYGFCIKETCLLPNAVARQWAMLRMPKGEL